MQQDWKKDKKKYIGKKTNPKQQTEIKKLFKEN